MAASDGLGTRTHVNFGQAIERMRRHHLYDFTAEDPPVNDRFLIYPYYRKLGQVWHGFFIVQAARQGGRFTIEIGLALHKLYPLHHIKVNPTMAVDGIRVRAAALMNEDDHWWDYKTVDELINRLRELTERVRGKGFRYLYDTAGGTLLQESMRVQEMINQWELDERRFAERPLGSRFVDLMMEERVYEYVQQCMFRPDMRPVLGRMRKDFDDPAWLSCFVYVMSTLMETGQAEEMARDVRYPIIQDEEMTTLCGRVPYYAYLDSVDSFEERVNRYCFFKALNALEAQYASANRLKLTVDSVTTLPPDV